MTGEYKHRIGAEELQFEARLQEFFDRARAKWDAANMRKGMPPTKAELDNFMLWETSVEDTERDRFYGA